MSAQVYSGARFGASSEVSSTGIVIGNISFNFASEQAFVENHIGTNIGMSVFNDTAEVTLDGVLAAKGTGFVVGIADTVTLANANADSLNVFTDGLFSTPVGSASVIITGGSMARNNKAFEVGNLTGTYQPAIATGTGNTYTLSD
jgi:hypothetical protein